MNIGSATSKRESQFTLVYLVACLSILLFVALMDYGVKIAGTIDLLLVILIFLPPYHRYHGKINRSGLFHEGGLNYLFCRIIGIWIAAIVAVHHFSSAGYNGVEALSVCALFFLLLISALADLLRSP